MATEWQQIKKHSRLPAVVGHETGPARYDGHFLMGVTCFGLRVFLFCLYPFLRSYFSCPFFLSFLIEKCGVLLFFSFFIKSHFIPSSHRSPCFQEMLYSFYCLAGKCIAWVEFVLIYTRTFCSGPEEIFLKIAKLMHAVDKKSGLICHWQCMLCTCACLEGWLIICYSASTNSIVPNYLQTHRCSNFFQR